MLRIFYKLFNQSPKDLKICVAYFKNYLNTKRLKISIHSGIGLLMAYSNLYRLSSEDKYLI